STGYWNAMKTPSRARVSGSMARRSCPLKETDPLVTSYSGCRAMTRASVLLREPLGPLMACTWPASIERSIPRRISRPPPVTCRLTISSIGLANAALQRDAQELLRFHGELHRQLSKDFTAEAAHDQVDGVLARHAALPAIEDLILADLRRRRLVLHVRRRVLDVQ